MFCGMARAGRDDGMARKGSTPDTRVPAIGIRAVCGVAATDPVCEVSVLRLVRISAEFLP